MKRRLEYEEIPYPVEKLKRVDQTTTKITENVQRFDRREQGFYLSRRGVYGPVTQREFYRLGKTPIIGAEMDVASHLAKVLDGEIASLKAPIPENPVILSQHIKRLAYFLRADMVGICKLPQYAVYTHDYDGTPIENNHQFSIVILIDQEYETMQASNGYDWISGCQSFLSYSTSGFIACIMANYIRRLGYPARAHFEPSYQVAVPPLVLLAGLGEMSRMGNSVLNPFLGARFKASVVTTDLPLLPDKPIDFGLQKFCSVCKKCAIECPANAISMGDKVMYNGYETWRLDVERCTKFRVTNPAGVQCGRCIKICPWNKPSGWTHNMVRRMIRHTPFMDRIIVKMDDIWGYGKQNTREKWWFDLEEMDGILRIPER